MEESQALLVVSREAFEEIKEKLIQAGHQRAFQEVRGQFALDLTGIALAAEDREE